jgi:hypothetical protein
MKTNQTTTTTTVTTTTRRRKIPAPKPLRLVKRVRTITVRTPVASPGKAIVRRRGQAVPVKRADVLSVTTTSRRLPAPTPVVSELTVKQRQRLPAPRR